MVSTEDRLKRVQDSRRVLLFDKSIRFFGLFVSDVRGRRLERSIHSVGYFSIVYRVFSVFFPVLGMAIVNCAPNPSLPVSCIVQP